MTIAVNPQRPAAGEPRPYHFPGFDRSRLANGLTIWLVPIAGATLTNVHLLLDAGAATEDEAHAGIAALTAQLLVTGTARLDAAAFAEATERLGIGVSSESSWDSSRAVFQSLPEHVETGLALLAEMLQQPRLDPGEFERLKAERLADILQARADPGRLADESFRTHLYAATSPYQRSSAGGPETVGGLTVEDARSFHATNYRPSGAHLVVAGAFDPDRVLAAAETHLGQWSGSGPGHRQITAAAAGGRRVVIVDRPGSVQSELRVGRIGIDRFDPRLFPAMTLATVIGGMFWSRLNRRLREELGYTYGARCGFDPRRAAGPFVATAAVQTEVTAPALAELCALLQAASDHPPTDAELVEARTYQVGIFPLRFETTGGIAAAIEPLAIYDLPDDYWQTYRSRIEGVTATHAAGAARDLLRTDDLLMLAVGEASAITAEVEKLDLGPVEVVTAP